MAKKKQVKCVECGFLSAKKKGVIELPIHAADASIREEAAHMKVVYTVSETGDPEHTSTDLAPEPYCYLNKHPLDAEYKSLSGENSYRSNFLLVIRSERKCDGFTVWDRTKTPSEHDMIRTYKKDKFWTETKSATTLGLSFAALIVSLSVLFVGSGIFNKSEPSKAEPQPIIINITAPTAAPTK